MDIPFDSPTKKQKVENTPESKLGEELERVRKTINSWPEPVRNLPTIKWLANHTPTNPLRKTLAAIR